MLSSALMRYVYMGEEWNRKLKLMRRELSWNAGTNEAQCG